MIRVFGFAISELILGGIAGGVGTFLITLFGKGILPYEWKRFREESKEREEKIEDWYTESQEMIAQVGHIGRRSTRLPDVKYETMVEQLEPISERLETHAKTAPSEINEEAKEAVLAVGKLCTRLLTFAEIGEENSGFEHWQKLLQMIEQEEGEKFSDVELEEALRVLDEVAEKEPQYPDISEEQVQQEYIEEAAEVIDGEFEDGTETVEDLFNLPWSLIGQAFDTDVWNDLLEEMTRFYMQLFLINMTDKVYEVVEENKETQL